MPLFILTLVFLAFVIIAAIRTRYKGHRRTSIFLSIVAWVLLGFVLFVLFV